MPGGNRRMAGVQTACADYFLRLVEGQTLFLYQVHQTLQAHQSGVTLVAVIDIFLDAQFLQRQHSADTQKNLLFDTVLPVAAVKLVRDLAVPFAVQLVVRI